MNHFLDTNVSGVLIPNRDAANVTNSAASITAQANLCTGLYQRTPNFILVRSLLSTGLFVWEVADAKLSLTGSASEMPCLSRR